MAITAKQVNELRKATGAGMMDCKKALVESDGDMERAVEILRKKGQKVSAKRSDRDANEGYIFACGDSNAATIIELNCETDFVARNEDFTGLGEGLVKAAFEQNPADLEGLLGMDFGGETVESTLTSAMGKMGEKITISKYVREEGEAVVTYIHTGGRVGVIVAFDGADGVDIDEVGKDVAMQIAAMRPLAIDKDGVDPKIVEQELKIGREQALEQGKPEKMVDKIAEGKLNKFFKDNTLLNQDYVKDSSKSVGQYLKEKGPDLKVKAFHRIQLGSN